MANCSICDKHMTPIFRDGNDYWYLTCDRCLRQICHACCDTDDDGGCLCTGCMQEDALKKYGITQADAKD